MNLDHMDALAMLETAYDLLCTFQATIENSMECQHPDYEAVQNWCEAYEVANV